MTSTDLLALTAELVDIPSVSHDEAAITGWIEDRLRGSAPWLTVDRVGENVVARTVLGRGMRVVLAGHTDTVPVNGNAGARVDGDTLWGLGSCDMKGGLAVFLDLACTVESPAVDVTYVFYACEEVALEDNGLRTLLASRPELLAADAAILGEPTGGLVEAGCQGSMRVSARFGGVRAHTARPWMGRNAIHRLGAVVAALASYEERRVVLNGCEFREALQAVAVSGGVAGNVVPDAAELVLNHRYAPDRTPDEALAHVLSVLSGGGFDADDASDSYELLDDAAPAPPALDHPLLAALVASTGQPARAKLGWTDVSFFSAAGIPATNFGPGDPNLAHTRDEHVDRASIESVHAAVHRLLVGGLGAA
jgi:succinyl-diaminopimelate desuccinylase